MGHAPSDFDLIILFLLTTQTKMSSQVSQLERHLSYARHTCFHCQKIIINPEISSKQIKKFDKPTQGWIEFRNTFQFTVTQLLQASEYGCPIFERIVGSINGKVLRLESNATRTVNVHFDLVSITTDLQKTSSNVKRAKINCRWMDTDEGLIDYGSLKLNTYAFEAETGMYCTG